jgi:hypothetical protein
MLKVLQTIAKIDCGFDVTFHVEVVNVGFAQREFGWR